MIFLEEIIPAVHQTLHQPLVKSGVNAFSTDTQNSIFDNKKVLRSREKKPDCVLSQLSEYTPPGPSYNPPTTPPPIIPEVVSTPHTVQSLQRHAAYLQNQDPISPTFQRNLEQFIKGSLAQAQAGAQAYTELNNTNTTENARRTRQNCSRRSVQKGGVIYAHQARAIVKKKKDADTQKRVEAAEREIERLRKAVIPEQKKKGNLFSRS